MSNKKNQPKNKTLQEVKDAVSNTLFGSTKKEAMASNTCIMCKGEAEYFKDSLSLQEYRISGFCQDCQNKIFG